MRSASEETKETPAPQHWPGQHGTHPLVFSPRESQGQGSLVGCRLWGRTESDTTEATQQQQQQGTHSDARGGLASPSVLNCLTHELRLPHPTLSFLKHLLDPGVLYLPCFFLLPSFMATLSESSFFLTFVMKKFQSCIQGEKIVQQSPMCPSPSFNNN